LRPATVFPEGGFTVTHEGKIAVVTGGNKGIGFEICRQLARQGADVILTARDETKGKKACEELRKEGGRVRFHPLDVDDPASIRRFGEFVEKEFGRLDILVNNAGINIDAERTAADVEIETLTKTVRTNVYGPMLMCQAMLPMMRRHNYGRIVNVSSTMGSLTEMAGGYPAYRISKTSLNAVTRVLAYETMGTNIRVNSMCPGWVRTDMGGPEAERSVEEGADTAVWLSTLPDGGPTGGFFRDRKKIPW
jgi:NAD(P)-dependent dehydrogenase (short-subunit alcohol dehydrogenase family)